MPLRQRLDCAQRGGADLARIFMDRAPKPVAGTTVGAALPPGRSVPLSGAPLKNPLQIVAAVDDAPSIVQPGHDARIVVDSSRACQ